METEELAALIKRVLAASGGVDNKEVNTLASLLVSFDIRLHENAQSYTRLKKYMHGRLDGDRADIERQGNDISDLFKRLTNLESRMKGMEEIYGHQGRDIAALGERGAFPPAAQPGRCGGKGYIVVDPDRVFGSTRNCPGCLDCKLDTRPAARANEWCDNCRTHVDCNEDGCPHYARKPTPPPPQTAREKGCGGIGKIYIKTSNLGEMRFDPCPGCSDCSKDKEAKRKAALDFLDSLPDPGTGVLTTMQAPKHPDTTPKTVEEFATLMSNLRDSYNVRVRLVEQYIDQVKKEAREKWLDELSKILIDVPVDIDDAATVLLILGGLSPKYVEKYGSPLAKRDEEIRAEEQEKCAKQLEDVVRRSADDVQYEQLQKIVQELNQCGFKMAAELIAEKFKR